MFSRTFKALTLVLGLMTVIPASAALAAPITVEAGIGVVSLPGPELTHQLRLGYQLPVPGQWDAVLAATTAPLFLGLDQIFLAGRYHFGEPTGWQPFVMAGVGVMPLRSNAFGVQLGGGVNQWFSPDFGLSWNASLSLPPENLQLMTINADLSLKWRWEPFVSRSTSEESSDD